MKQKSSLSEKLRLGQVTIEFIGMFMIMFFVFLIFFYIASSRIGEMHQEKSWELLKSQAGIIKDEITLAAIMQDGYYRVFKVPERLEGINYSIVLLPYNGTNIKRSTLILQYVNFSMDTPYVLSLPDNLKGNVYKGENELRKDNGWICLNVNCT